MAHRFQGNTPPISSGKGWTPRCQAPSESTHRRGTLCGRMAKEAIHRIYPCRKFGCQVVKLSIEQRLIHEERDHHGNYGT